MDGTHRTKKRAAAILLGFFAAAALMLPSAQAAERTVSELIPVGQVIGVKLFSDGVLVVGLSDGESPAKACGLKEGDVKSEYLLPTIIDQMIHDGRARVKLLETHDCWFGVTYREDKPTVVAAIAQKTQEGLYPEDLWA
mgnify:CR=1 FL=1